MQLEGGVDLATVSDAAGHSNLNQTRAYCHHREQMTRPLANTAEDKLGAALGGL